jgi:hypothetical protein
MMSATSSLARSETKKNADVWLTTWLGLRAQARAGQLAPGPMAAASCAPGHIKALASLVRGARSAYLLRADAR